MQKQGSRNGFKSEAGGQQSWWVEKLLTHLRVNALITEKPGTRFTR